MRKLVVLAQALIAWAMLSSAASAVTLTPGDSVVLGSGSFYDADRPTIAANTAVNDIYTFTAAAVSAIYQSDGVFNGGAYSISNLTLTWFDVTAGANAQVSGITNPNGFNTGPATETIALVIGHVYNLIVTGTTNAAGGGYNLQIASTVSAVPLPPAAILLVTGLIGAGFASRRRKV